MIELAKHIVQTKSGHFNPDKFEDRYESALRELLKKKGAGKEVRPEKRREPARIITLIDALRRSVNAERSTESSQQKRAAAARKPSKRTHSSGRHRKAG
jgi:DNA end-binding protein Ku